MVMDHASISGTCILDAMGFIPTSTVHSSGVTYHHHPIDEPHPRPQPLPIDLPPLQRHIRPLPLIRRHHKIHHHPPTPIHHPQICVRVLDEHHLRAHLEGESVGGVAALAQGVEVDVGAAVEGGEGGRLIGQLLQALRVLVLHLRPCSEQLCGDDGRH